MDEIRPTPPEPPTDEEALAPPGTPPSLRIAPSLLNQPIFAIREDGDTDEDFETSKRIAAALTNLVRTG
jgi:hypothetical protein